MHFFAIFLPALTSAEEIKARIGSITFASTTLLEDKVFVDELLLIIDKFLKIHIHNQIKSGATIIQIFDSWAGLVNKEDLEKFIYKPTISLVKFIKSLNIPVICFPRNVENYKEYVETVMPDAVNIDYNVDPQDILKNINIPVQGGLDPRVLLDDKDTLKKATLSGCILKKVNQTVIISKEY